MLISFSLNKYKLNGLFATSQINVRIPHRPITFCQSFYKCVNKEEKVNKNSHENQWNRVMCFLIPSSTKYQQEIRIKIRDLVRKRTWPFYFLSRWHSLAKWTVNIGPPPPAVQSLCMRTLSDFTVGAARVKGAFVSQPIRYTIEVTDVRPPAISLTASPPPNGSANHLLLLDFIRLFPVVPG